MPKRNMMLPFPKKTKKAFIEYLDKCHPDYKYKNYAWGNRIRSYGVWLYNQDKCLFDLEYNEWLEGKHYTQMEKKHA